jgi:hypothetical protein
MDQPSKAVKRHLRQLAALAHEEDLRRALLPLASAFDEWRAGRLQSGELADVIHRFHDGAAREIWKSYTYAHDSAVARAIATGVLERDKVPPEVLEFLGNTIEHYAMESPGDDSS